MGHGERRIVTGRARIAVAAVAAVAVAVLATIVVSGPGVAGGRGTVTPAAGGSVVLGPARLVLPAGSVAADATVVALNGGPPAAVAPPDAGLTPQVAIASEPVTFNLTGAAAAEPATVTFRVAPDTVPVNETGDGGVWLARAAPGSERWSPVGGQYDRNAGTVTAQGEPSGSWAVWTWDWRGIELRLRRQLAVLGTGRAALFDCPGVEGVRAVADGRDPVLLGCARSAREGQVTVDVTGNRGYSMVLRVPDGADPGPPSYRGFEEYVRTRQRVVDALGGVYLAPTATLPFTLDARGDPVRFSAEPSWKTHVLDLSVPAATAVFDVVTLGYAECVLDSVARSGPTPLRDAPELILACFPVLAQATAALRFYLEHLEPLSAFLRTTLAALDEGRDQLAGETGVLRVTRPSMPAPSLYVSTGYERGALYPPTALPSRIGINNHEYIEELQWSAETSSGATATGVLNQLNCEPSCADGLYRIYDVEVIATAPESCSVTVYADGSDESRPVQTYAYTTVSIRPTLSDPSPDSRLLGDSVITGACR